jgi:hypothetical protein
MTVKVLGFTYKPKIEAVHDGRCDQTIRKGRRINTLDELLLFTWSGKPYRSPWLWRKRAICVEAIPIKAHTWGFELLGHCDGERTGAEFAWDTSFMDSVAARDYINPPTGTGLRDVLLKTHKIGEDGKLFQIIRWKGVD